MYTVEVSVPFEAAHILPKHDGKCKNLHGHNYVLKAGFKADMLDDQAMVVDFGNAKRYIKEYLEEHVDHAFIITADEKIEIQTKIYSIETSYEQATAEVMARHFYAIFSPILTSLSYIIIEETPGCWAKYEK